MPMQYIEFSEAVKTEEKKSLIFAQILESGYV